MIVVYGTRACGKVDACDGEFAVTRFFHIYWLPLFPVSGTFWVTADADAPYGHRMRFSWRSLAAAYLRSWGLLLGAVLLVMGIDSLGTAGVSSEWPAVLIGLVTLGLSLLSFAWYSARGDERARRRLFSQVSGSCCDPEDLIDAEASDLLQRIEAEWAERYPGQPPEDAVRFGASEPRQVAWAHAILRLRARSAPRDERSRLHALGDALLSSAPVELPPGDGPFRNQARPV